MHLDFSVCVEGRPVRAATRHEEEKGETISQFRPATPTAHYRMRALDKR